MVGKVRFRRSTHDVLCDVCDYALPGYGNNQDAGRPERISEDDLGSR